MKNYRYIGKKYENDICYDMYYDEENNWMVLIDKNNPDIEEYRKLDEEDKISIALQNKAIAVKKAKEAQKKLERRKKIFKSAIVVLMTIGSGAIVATNQDLNYPIRYMLNSDNASEINSEYIKYTIDKNKTISLEVKAYLLSFFDKVMSFDEEVEAGTMRAIANRISDYDFSNVDLSDQKKTILLLENILNTKKGVSTRYLSREFYEYYFNLEPSKKSQLFDALNGDANSSLCVEIVNGGDNAYFGYLSQKYGFNQERAKEIRRFLYSIDDGLSEERYDFNYYISWILSFNSKEFGFLNEMDRYFDYKSLENGDCTYDGNIFRNTAVIRVQNTMGNYDVYYDKDLECDVTRLTYTNKFYDLIKNFNGHIDRENLNDRFIVYLHTFLTFQYSEDFLDENMTKEKYLESLYNMGVIYNETGFYQYLNNERINYSQITTILEDLVNLAYFKEELTENQKALLAEALICLQREVKAGYLASNEYEHCYYTISIIIREMYGEEELFNFQKMIDRENYSSANELIPKYYLPKNKLNHSLLN